MDTSLVQLLTMLREASETPRETIPELLGELERLRAVLVARIVAGLITPTLLSRRTDTLSQPDRLLTPKEAAHILGVSVRWLHRHHRSLPFSKKVSRKSLRFSATGLQRWIATRNSV